MLRLLAEDLSSLHICGQWCAESRAWPYKLWDVQEKVEIQFENRNNNNSSLLLRSYINKSGTKNMGNNCVLLVGPGALYLCIRIVSFASVWKYILLCITQISDGKKNPTMQRVFFTETEEVCERLCTLCVRKCFPSFWETPYFQQKGNRLFVYMLQSVHDACLCIF